MTVAPVCVHADEPATHALSTMLSYRCRHLPVLDPSQRILVGLLDVNRCLFDAMAAATHLASAHRPLSALLDDDARSNEPKSSVNAQPRQLRVTVKQKLTQAAVLMSERRSALLVTGDKDMVGILTTKDLFLRGVAKGVQYEVATIGELMTPNPDVLPRSASILQALHSLSAGGYRTVAVAAAHGQPAGVLDVLALLEAALAGSPLTTAPPDTPTGTPAVTALPLTTPPRSRGGVRGLLVLSAVIGAAAAVALASHRVGGWRPLQANLVAWVRAR